MRFKELGDKTNPAIRVFHAVSWILLVLVISGCSQRGVSCSQRPWADLSGALTYAANNQLEFQFPLDELGLDADPAPAKFCKASWGENTQYHAAEDYHLPAGSPVYAFADGVISFSGPMGGYGWLIIIDHPQHNIYSLYGHLSPSRWYLKSGSVEKGDLIGYLGDSDENGGSAKNPLVTHLHFAVRVGQRTDYAGFGEWRWMAGWIKPCPSDLGWFKPSAIITEQVIPPGGFPEPTGGLFEKWGGEIGLASLYVIMGAGVIIDFQRKGKAHFLLIYGCTMIAASWYFSVKGTRIQYALNSMAALSLSIAIYHIIKGRKGDPGEGERENRQE